MSEFMLLDDRSHVLKRPSMYIGSTSVEPHNRFLFGNYGSISYVQGLVKIIDEIIDNSVDEAIRTKFDFANKIEIDIDSDTVSVKDNGRGLPQKMVATPEGGEIPLPVAAWTRLKAGSNFDDTNRVTQGMNGMGAALTNTFSARFVGDTCNGENLVSVSCIDGASYIDWSERPCNKRGTTVTFTPDFKHFECDRITDTVIDVIHDRIMSLSVIFPQIKFKFNGKAVNGKFKSYAALYGENPVIVEDDNYSISFTSSTDGFLHMTFVNGLNTKVGGTHVDYLTDELCDELSKGIKRQYKVDIPKAQVKNGLKLLAVIRNLPNLRFDSQTKERLTNPLGEVKKHLAIDFKKLSRQILKSESVIMPIIATALARKEAAEKAASTKANNAAKRAKVAKHIKANLCGTDAPTMLLLTEGDSAINHLIDVRDQDLHGGFPLRGKPLTTWGKSDSEIFKNAEISNIMTITGLKFGESPFDVLPDGTVKCNMQYQSIGIMVDADVDGLGSIQPSLLAFFARWPELFEHGRIKLIRTPVIIAEPKKGEPRWFYNLEDYEKESGKMKNWNIRYIKGLASLRAHEYGKAITQPVEDVIQLPENYKELFDLLYGDDSDSRKVWMSN